MDLPDRWQEFSLALKRLVSSAPFIWRNRSCCHLTRPSSHLRPAKKSLRLRWERDRSSAWEIERRFSIRRPLTFLLRRQSKKNSGFNGAIEPETRKIPHSEI